MAQQRSVMNLKTQPGPAYAPASGGEVCKPTEYYDEYTFKAGDAQNDTIVFGTPKALHINDRWLGCKLDWDLVGAGTTLAVGDDGSAGRYVAAAASTAAGQSILAVNGSLGYKLTQDRDLIVTVAGGAPTAGAKIRMTWRVLRG